MARGRFISVEGIEGVGKSTHLRFIRAWLVRRAVRVLCTREPGGTVLAEQIRRLLLDSTLRQLPPLSELLLMFAARASHVREVIRPALASGRWVLCDRFSDASYAYQGAGRGLGPRPVATLELLVLGRFKPDFTLLLDAPVQTGLARMRKRGPRDRFEREQQTFFQRVRRAYLARARQEPRRFQIVDARGEPSVVRARIATVLEERVSRWL
ncbi:MAG: dTMP kinase [Gammaproteobacteria bacterium]